MRSPTTVFGLLALVVALASCGGSERPVTRGAMDELPPMAPRVKIENAGTITGVVLFKGVPPAMPVIDVGSSDPDCALTHSVPVRSEEVVVGDGGGLANVVVHIEGFSELIEPPDEARIISQKGCQYVPHVSAVQVGQTVQIRNDDQTLHNVHGIATENRSFNVGQPVQGFVTERTFSKPELPVKLKCDVHGWMESYVAVFSHPYFAVTGGDGAFSIGNVPPGTYTLEAWHESYGMRSVELTIGASEDVRAEFAFGAE